jgi:DNA-binding beta-propeller fold protein YncE
MQDVSQLRRDMRKINSRTKPVRDDAITPEEWSLIEEVEELPEVDEEVVGRIFLRRNDNADDVLSAGITSEDGTPLLVDLTTRPSETGTIRLESTAILTGLGSPRGLYIDASDNLFVGYIVTGGATSERIRKYNPALAIQWTKDAGSFPLGHLAGNASLLYNTYYTNDSLARFSLAGGISTLTGSTGTGNNNYDYPLGIVADATHVWIVDRLNNRVKKHLGSDGTYVSKFGTLGSADGQFDTPTAITLKGGKLYVLDAANGRVQKFDAATHAHELTLTFGVGNGAGQISDWAEGIAVDALGQIWISDTGNSRIQVFDGTTGEIVVSVGSYGGGIDRFKNPRQIQMNAAGDTAYVADYANDRVVQLVITDSALPPAPMTMTPVITLRSASAGGISAGTEGAQTATCAAGETVTGGGASCTNVTRCYLKTSEKAGNGWRGRCYNDSATNGCQVLVDALCMQTPFVED